MCLFLTRITFYEHSASPRLHFHRNIVGCRISQGRAKEWNKEPVAVLQQGAEAGNAQAQFVLATCT